MNIGGFHIGKTQIIIIAVIVGIIIIGTLVSNSAEQKELQKRQTELEERAAAADAAAEQGMEEIDEDEEMRKALIKEFGEPPEGFMWNDEGELYALSDDGKTAEEVVYTYIRSVSIQDFSTAQKYAKRSQIIKSYNKFYDDALDADYYNLFLRKQFKFAITAIELVETTDSAIFADGTTVISMKLKVLDLTDKDFWRGESETIYNKLRTFKSTEEDDIKANQYLYDYVYSKYEDGTVKKKDIVVDFKLVKEYGSGWLIEDDSELDHHLLYEEGFDVVPYIKTQYGTWLENTINDEAEAEERRLLKEEEKKMRQEEKAAKKKGR